MSRGTFGLMPSIIRFLTCATLVSIATYGTASGAVVLPPPVAIADTGVWHDLTPTGLDNGSPQLIAPVGFDSWTVSISNTGPDSWAGFKVRFSQDAGGAAMTFVTHFEPRFTQGLWANGVLLLDASFALAEFDAVTTGFTALSPDSTVMLNVPLFNLTEESQLYHLQIMAISEIPGPCAAAILLGPVLSRTRRRNTQK